MKVCKLSTILNQLSSPDRLERNAAVVDLTDMGEAARPALPALKKLLSDEPIISIGAAGVIVQIEPDNEAAMTVLLEGLNDKCGSHISMACQFLGKLGAKAQFAIPLLMPLLGHEWDTVKCNAAEAIGWITGDWSKLVCACVGLLSDDDLWVRNLGEECLLLAGQHSKHAILSSLRVTVNVAPWEVRLEVEDVIEKLTTE